MKESVILEVLSGSKTYLERIKFKLEDEYDKLIHKVYEKLMLKLSPELKELFSQHDELMIEKNIELIDLYFVEGFKLGLQVGFECMDKPQFD